jgi:diguanylate cyclase (GGDEF)-like protein
VAERPLAVTVGLSPDEEDAPLRADQFREGARAIVRSFLPPADADAVTALRGAVSVPLGPPEAYLGTLTVFRRGRPFEPRPGDLDVLEELAAALAPAIEVGRRFREAATLADVDSLTRLRSRRYFHQMLASEIARARRYDRRLTVMVLDVDDFKTVNERIGHLEGDRLLAVIGRQISSLVRTADIACRVGGDEFAVILPESGSEHAQQLHRRIEAALAGHAPLRLSAGIAELRPSDEDGRALFRRADAALFEAKGAGKGIALRAVGGEEPN